MKRRDENFRFSPSEPAMTVLTEVLQGVKDPMNSMDNSIRLLEMMLEDKQLLEAHLPAVVGILSIVFDKMKFVVNVAHIYLEESEPKQ